MPVSRRSFLRALGAGSAGAFVPFVTARGSEARAGLGLFDAFHDPGILSASEAANVIRLSSNENPNGPSPVAIEALKAALTEANRYPDDPQDMLREAIANVHGVSPAHVILGCGSGELLKIITQAYTSRERALVTAAPTFENPTKDAKLIGAPVREVKVDDRLRLDLEGMVSECAGAGLVFFCNPNNPTGTVYGDADARAFITRVHARSPATTILVDEAYFEYVDDPAYRTMIPVALQDPRVIVSRTFSKVYGMAGLRVGYAVAHVDTIARLEPMRLGSGVNVLAAAAALASLPLTDHVAREQSLNRDARDYTVRSINEMGYSCAPTNTNFVIFDIKRDSKAFQAQCLERGVAIGRQFPPLLTHARISIGTMDEMQRALPVLRDVLRASRADRRG